MLSNITTSTTAVGSATGAMATSNSASTNAGASDITLARNDTVAAVSTHAGIDIYETDDSVAQYLLLHYGREEGTVLPCAVRGDGTRGEKWGKWWACA
jgi:hypothetical protein